MGKKKLRSCANCGGRHGPPTGKGCTQTAELLEEKNKEMQMLLDGGLEPHSEGGEERQAYFSEDEQLDFTYQGSPLAAMMPGRPVTMVPQPKREL